MLARRDELSPKHIVMPDIIASVSYILNLNYGIGSPLSETEKSERPLWAWIVKDENYLERYHEIFDELIFSYFESGDFEKEIDSIYEMIRPYAKKDPSAFYPGKTEKACQTLKEYCLKRSQSIRKQLDGQLQTINALQKEEDRIPSDGIRKSDMGQYGNHWFSNKKND